MPTLTSRILLAVEVLLLGIPAAPYFLMIVLAWLGVTVESPRHTMSLATLVWIISIGSFLFAAYRVSFAFIHGGSTALSTLHKAWWWLCFAGAAYAVLATLLATHYVGTGKDLGLLVETSGMYGLLYLIPLAHLLLEKYLRKLQLPARNLAERRGR